MPKNGLFTYPGSLPRGVSGIHDPARLPPTGMTERSSRKINKREAIGAFAGQGGLFTVFVFGVLIQCYLRSERHSAFGAFELARRLCSSLPHHYSSSCDQRSEDG